ncbi:hypothetical protein MCQ_00147 [Candidatus Bartonella washoeensis Sb944nv]|uniref:Uncharacterized protein n=2 Tax=Candidatus Bartonella washoeensis TaxID=186739 RepID=J0ZD24_9HYPH|nr:hypothetical protein MCQ_00147 [Bartonella washoeensis Sb944nv]EJF85848.1 hypothetical protein MCW_00835 [Bartonella washoeensis 085-0475]
MKNIPLNYIFIDSLERFPCVITTIRQHSDDDTLTYRNIPIKLIL